MSNHAAAWLEAAPLLANLQQATANGAIFVVKVDNERSDTQIFTVVITGGKFRDRHFRQDGSDLVTILRNALAFCREAGSNKA